MTKYEKKMKEIVEYCANLEHERWSKWQVYLHDKCSRHPDGLLISNSDVQHWERQIATHYFELSEEEKESDREQVYPYLKYLIKEFKKLT